MFLEAYNNYVVTSREYSYYYIYILSKMKLLPYMLLLALM